LGRDLLPFRQVPLARELPLDAAHVLVLAAVRVERVIGDDDAPAEERAAPALRDHDVARAHLVREFPRGEGIDPGVRVAAFLPRERLVDLLARRVLGEVAEDVECDGDDALAPEVRPEPSAGARADRPDAGVAKAVAVPGVELTAARRRLRVVVGPFPFALLLRHPDLPQRRQPELESLSRMLFLHEPA